MNSRQDSGKWRTNFLLWLVLAVGLVVRLPLLNGSLWLDEAAQALESARPWSQQLQLDRDFQPPLLHLLLKLTMSFGSTEWWLRTTGALIPGLVTVAAVYFILKKISSTKAAFLGSLLLALNSFHVFYSQELRPYSLPAMWAALGWWILLELETSAKSKSWRLWLAWVLVSVAGLYSSYLYPFALLGQGLYLLVRLPKQRLQTIVASVATSICFLPWLPFFQRQLADSQSVQQALPNWGSVVGTPVAKSLFLVVGKFIFGVSDLELNLQTLLALAIVVGGTALLGWWASRQPSQKSTQQRNQLFWILICWLVLPIVVAWLVSFKIPILQAKRVLFALPAWAVLVGWLGAYPLKKINQKMAAHVWFILVVGIQVVSLVQYWRQPNLQREDWRQLISTIQTSYQDRSSVAVFAFDQPFATWIWYADPTFPTISLGQLASHQVDLPDKLKTATEYRYVLVFDYLRDLTDPADQVLLEITQLGYDQVSVIDQPVIGFVRVFARPTDTIGLAE